MDQSGTNEPKANIAGLYNRVASSYGQVGPNFFADGGRRLVEHMAIVERAKVLDVGVGRGANLFPAAEKVGPRGRVIGIDLAENMVRETAAEIQRRSIVQASVLVMDAEQLAFPADTFDDVLCGFAIFLFPHQELALTEFLRVLRPGGKLGITIMRNGDSLEQWYSRRITEYHDHYHFPLNAGGGNLDLSELPAYLERIGFIDVKVQQVPTEVIYTDAQQWWDAKWTHGTRYSLEHMDPEVLAQFKKEVFAHLQEVQQPDGIHEKGNFQFIIGNKA